jgi:hypothetical protein
MKSFRLSALLAAATIALGAGTVLAQWPQHAPARQSRAPSIVGSWHQVLPSPDGSISHVFWIFQPNGDFLYTSVQMGGQQAGNGMRVEYWGRYQASPAANGTLFVRIDLTGYAPQQICMQGGGGCRSVNAPPSLQQGYYQVRSNVMQTNGVTARRENAPPEMTRQLPAVWMLQPPPPLPSGGGGYAGGGGVPCVGAGLSRGPDGGCHVNGQGGTCDDAQQRRICEVRTNGYLWRNRQTGCLVCS